MSKLLTLATIAAFTILPAEAAINHRNDMVSKPLAKTETLIAARKFKSANVDQVKEGMTLPQVQALIGKGRKESQINVGGMTGVNYIWGRMVINRFVQITFIDGKVSTIYRAGI